MLRSRDALLIGEVAARSGLAPSAVRHYETLGLIGSDRLPGGRRVFRRSVLRRLAVIRAGQRVGLSLTEIRESFGALDAQQAPTRQQWRAISRQWSPLLEARIRDLERVRDSLHQCVGCGCLSMRQCVLFNPQDVLAAQGGSGARRLLPGAPDTDDPEV